MRRISTHFHVASRESSVRCAVKDRQIGLNPGRAAINTSANSVALPECGE